MQRLRLFVALDLPPEIKRVVDQVQIGLRAGGWADRVRWVDPAGTHITLKYLGETDQVAQVKAELDVIGPDARPFRLQTTQPGAFPNARDPRILWLGVGGDLAALGRVQRLVEARIAPLGFPTETRPFRAHITLGRAQQRQRPRPSPATFEAGDGVQPAAWSAGELVLMVSETGPQGARYTPIHAVRFDDHR